MVILMFAFYPRLSLGWITVKYSLVVRVPLSLMVFCLHHMLNLLANVNGRCKFIVHTKKDSLLTFSGNKIHQLRKCVSYNSNILLQLSNLNIKDKTFRLSNLCSCMLKCMLLLILFSNFISLAERQTTIYLLPPLSCEGVQKNQN